MGFSPHEIDQMTIWEFRCCEYGYREAHKSEEDAPPPMDDDDLAALGIKGF